MHILKKISVHLLWLGLLGPMSMAQSLPDLTLSSPKGDVQNLVSGPTSTVQVHWTVTNTSEIETNSTNISVFLTKVDETAKPPRKRRRDRTLQPGQWDGTRTSTGITTFIPRLGGILVHQETTGTMAAQSSRDFSAGIQIPRAVESGSWNLVVYVDSQTQLAESDETNNSLTIPLTLNQQGTGTFTLTFEGIGEGLIPTDFYAGFGVQMQLMVALIAGDAGGTGNFCSVHNGSAQVGFTPRAESSSVLINVPDGFSDVSMIYAQSEETQGGFHVWSGENGTGSIVFSYFFFPHPNNGQGNIPCLYDVWFDTGIIEAAGKSIQFFENDAAVDQSWFLFDNITFTPSRNNIVVHDDPITPFEGESSGHTFGITLSDPVPAGKTVTIKLERVSSSSSGESMAVTGSSTVSFNSSNWNIQKSLTIRAPENDTDTGNQVREFRLYRSSGTSPQSIPDQLLSVMEVDDDFNLTVDVASSANHGSVDPIFNNEFFDFNDDDWSSLVFVATPDPGYLFSEWTVTSSGENNDHLFQLFGTAQNPTQIAQLTLDSGGGTSVAVFANFDEIGPVTVSMIHNGSGSTRVNGQIVGNNQSIQIDPAQNISLTATPASGWAFNGWSSNPSGVIANLSSTNTTINTSVDTQVTAHFIPVPVTVSVFHNGEGSTTVNGQTVGANQSIQIPSGQSVPIVATPDPEWEFSGWTSSPNGIITTPNTATTTMSTTLDANLTANFTFVGTAFTVQSSGHGTTDPNGLQFVDSGDSVIVQVIPDEGYKFKDWTVQSGNPEIIPIGNQPDSFFVTITDETVIIANFEVQTPGSLVIRATNLQNTAEVVLLREPNQVFQELIFLKQQDGSPNTYKLEFFNEGDLPLVIETVTLTDRAVPLPSLIDSGFCLQQTQNFDPLDCVIEQLLSTEPLPQIGMANPPTLYLDFGREPGFPDLPNPTPDFYVGTFAYLVPPNQTTLVFDFQGIVQGSTDVSNISLEKISPDPQVSIANGGSVELNAVGGGSIIGITFKLTNADTMNPFFAEKMVLNSNDASIDPNEYGFFFTSSDTITVPEGGMLEFGMQLKTMAIGENEPNVAYTAIVELGTGDNIYAFQISAIADGTSVTLVAKSHLGDGVFSLQEVLEGELHILQPDPPEAGGIFEFQVINTSSQQSLEIANLRLEPIDNTENNFSIEQDRSALPGSIPSGSRESFWIRLKGMARPQFYRSKVLFDYRSPTGSFKTFSYFIEGMIVNALVDILDETNESLAYFDALTLPTSSTGDTVSQSLQIRHSGQNGSQTLSGSITPTGTGFSIDNPNFSLQPGQFHPFQVSFTGPGPGEFEGEVTVASNDPIVDTFVVSLSGTVFEPGAPPSAVPNFVGRIDGTPIDGLTVYQTAPLLTFTWDDAQSPLGIERYQIVLQPHGGPWLYSQQLTTPVNDASIQTEDLVFGTSYSIHIRARDTASVWGPFNNGGSFILEEPGPPSTVPNFVGRIDGENIDGLVIDVTNPAVDFTWSPATSPLGIKSYQLVLQPIGGPWLYLPVLPGSAQTHTIQTSNLVPGTSYSIHARAKDNDDVWGPFNNGGTFSLEAVPPPSEVPNFVGRIDGQNTDGLTIYDTDPRIDFTWNHASSSQGIERYHIVVQPTDGSGWLYSQHVFHPSTSHSIQTANLEFGKSYSIHIRARDNLGIWGPYNNGGTFNVEEPGPPISVPNFVGRIGGQNIDGLMVSVTNPTIDFTWNHASASLGIERYQIVLQPVGGPWLYSPSVFHPDTNHSIQTAGLQFGTSYSIHIRARDTAGTWGPFNNSGTFTVEAPVAPSTVPNFIGRIGGQNVAGLTVNVTDPTVDFTWSHASAGLPIERYQIVLQPIGGPWLYSQQVFYPATSHTIQTSGLVYGTSYSIHSRARDTAGTWGSFNNGGTFTVEAPTPGTVPNFVGRINGQNIADLVIQSTNPAIDFTWDHVTDPTGIDRYQIVVQPTDGSGWLYSPQIIYPSNNHTINTSGLIPGKSYSIHIRARNGLGTWGPFNNSGVLPCNDR